MGALSTFTPPCTHQPPPSPHTDTLSFPPPPVPLAPPVYCLSLDRTPAGTPCEMGPCRIRPVTADGAEDSVLRVHDGEASVHILGPCVDGPHFALPSTMDARWWFFPSGCCGQQRQEDRCADICLSPCFQFFWVCTAERTCGSDTELPTALAGASSTVVNPRRLRAQPPVAPALRGRHLFHQAVAFSDTAFTKSKFPSIPSLSVLAILHQLR